MKLGTKVCIITLIVIGIFTIFFVKGYQIGNKLGIEGSAEPVEGFIVNGVFYPY